MKSCCVIAVTVSLAVAWTADSARSQGSRPGVRGAGADAKETGRLQGLVRLKGLPKPPPPLKVYKHTEFCGSHVPDETLLVSTGGGLRNVVVTMHAVSAKEDPRRLGRSDITLDNKDCRFVPHVQAAQVGSTLVLLNSDGILHDAHAFIGADTLFNEGLPVWRRVEKTLARAGVVRVLCELHRAWMSAFIVVTSSPYFAVTDRQGAFLIDDVSAGTYSVRFWHERLGELSRRVVIEPGKTSEAELAFDCPAC